MTWLLLFIPITVALEKLAPGNHLLIFASSALAIMPLAGKMVHATEALAEKIGQRIAAEFAQERREHYAAADETYRACEQHERHARPSLSRAPGKHSVS